MRQQKSGRLQEVNEIVKLHRAIQVAFLMMGKLEGKMDRIYPDKYLNKPRKDIKEYRKYLKSHYKQNVNAFCAQNFINMKWTDLSKIYEPLYEKDCLWRLPLIDFNRFFGETKNNVIKNTPLHATLVLSPLGLQVEYPEMHFIDDLAISFNSLYALEKESNSNATSWKKVKKEIKQNPSKGSFGKPSFYKRMCLLSCFNLIESYINGLSWGYVQTHDTSSLSNNKQRLLTEGKDSIRDKLLKIPQIVAGFEDTDAPLKEDEEPLSLFMNIIKPFRDSIVHASPFSAPERFGGYDKLSKIYELNFETTKQAVDVTLELVGIIHRFIGGERQLPHWIPERTDDGFFLID